MHPPALILTAGLIGQVLACFALVKSGRAWRRGNHPADLAMILAAGLWLLSLVASTLLALLDADLALVVRVNGVAAQALTLSVALLLVICARIARTGIYLALVAHLVAGFGALTWYLSGPRESLLDGRTGAYWTWIGINLLSIALLSILLARTVRDRPSLAMWMTLAASLLGLLLWIDGLFPPQPQVDTVNFTQLFYAAFLFVVWQVGKQRIFEHRETDGSGFGSSTGFETLSGFGPGHEDAVRAVATERRRIAQDLHDNVGSQIVNILATLNTRGSQLHETVGLALEQCLLDLKLTVDTIDSGNDSVLEALGRLRQRVQGSLDARGIKLLWKIQICDELDVARGWIAIQVLRVAQECLSNVIRHANATTVEVACRYSDQPGEIVLEIRDNGCGIERDRRRTGYGKGLDNMRRRAQAAGGSLVIASKVGTGTRVRLVLPFNPRLSGWREPTA